MAAGQSALLDTLLDLVGKGTAHIETVAQIARAVKSDSQQPIHEGLQKIAACGTHGKHDANTERDFQRLLRGSNDFFVEPYSIKLTLQVTPPGLSNLCFFGFRPSPCPLPRFNAPTTNGAQVEKDEHPREVEASVLLPHEVFGALHSMGAAKAGGSTFATMLVFGPPLENC